MTRPRQELRSDALAIAMAGIEAADAGLLVERALAADDVPGPLPVRGGRLDSVRGGRLQAARVHVLAAGKAARAMAAAAERALGTRIRSGLIVAALEVRGGRLQPARLQPDPLDSIVAGHPVPTTESERAGRRALELAASVPPDDTLLVLLSGGASSLLAVPAEGLTLDDKRQTTQQLLRSGADIVALNTVRKHLSAIKGGWLAAAARCPCRTLVMSDVVGDDVSVIASGPTVADATTFADALEVLREHGGLDAYPDRVIARLHAGVRGEIAETPKPGDPRLSRAQASVIGGRFDAMDGAAREGEARGYRVIRLDAAIVGEARTAAPRYLRDALAQAAGADGPVCIVSSGETTVRVTGDGNGGRNQEFALAAAASMYVGAGLSRPKSEFALVSVGTDGVDGPTAAAGAIVDTTTLERARSAGLDAPAQYLDANNAYAFFDRLSDLIRTGPTGTNVGDLQVLLLA